MGFLFFVVVSAERLLKKVFTPCSIPARRRLNSLPQEGLPARSLGVGGRCLSSAAQQTAQEDAPCSLRDVGGIKLDWMIFVCIYNPQSLARAVRSKLHRAAFPAYRQAGTIGIWQAP